MITEDYCSYEISKLLEEKGFDEECEWYYPKDGGEREQLLLDELNYDYQKGQFIKSPSHALAMKWLREVHGLFIQIGYYEDWADDADGKKVDSWNYWGIDIFYLPSGLRVDPEITDQYDTYKEAVEAAIKYSLENLI